MQTTVSDSVCLDHFHHPAHRNSLREQCQVPSRVLLLLTFHPRIQISELCAIPARIFQLMSRFVGIILAVQLGITLVCRQNNQLTPEDMPDWANSESDAQAVFHNDAIRDNGEQYLGCNT
jgi:hypothetical protein